MRKRVKEKRRGKGRKGGIEEVIIIITVEK